MDREDDYIVGRKIWETEMAIALKAHNKFLDSGVAIFLTINGQIKPTVWDKMCADSTFAAIQDEKCPVQLVGLMKARCTGTQAGV